MNEFKPCFIVPVYNHPAYLSALIAHLDHYQHPIILVDDGSDADCRAAIDSLISPHLTVIHHPQNQGKGQAVMSALKHAHAQGYSHALQIDADGQHHWDDITKFFDTAKHHPQAVILGTPIYGDDVPKKRLYGRYATHVWVWINSLSFAIKDSMCGFRVYPVATSMAVIGRHRLRQRMGFDSEILVYLSWQGAKFINIATPVSYPADGVSHFRLWQDNVELSKMHAELFFKMLIRLPKLALRNIQHRHSTSNTHQSPP